MEFTVAVPYFDAVACYKIIPDHQNIYHAQLISYDGSPDYDPPPSVLVLVKGVRNWLGSSDHQDFLNELGNVIEAKMQSEDFITVDHRRLSAYHYKDPSSEQIRL